MKPCMEIIQYNVLMNVQCAYGIPPMMSKFNETMHGNNLITMHAVSYCTEAHVNKKSYLGIFVGVIVGILVVIVVLGLIIVVTCKRCFPRGCQSSTYCIKQFKIAIQQGSPLSLFQMQGMFLKAAKLGRDDLPMCRSYSLEELKEATNNSTFVGENTYGKLYKGKLDSGIQTLELSVIDLLCDDEPNATVEKFPTCEDREDFEKIFSQAKSEVASCGGGSESSPLDPGVEEKIRNQSWFFAAGGKNKGRVYGVEKVEVGYRCGDNFTQPTTSSASSQKITMLEEKVHKTQEENERLSRKFETLLNVVLPLLPADAAQQIFQQSKQNQQDPQQPSPQPSNQAAENQ
ncbi:hypothetical protein Fmac_001023 [Flemingia macrophylla]|uniref:Uncharacterized protein n=1 Tax=Flemingia macrophylla TaxID=520843 RepID=A0ABD1NFW8_9FABA